MGYSPNLYNLLQSGMMRAALNDVSLAVNHQELYDNAISGQNAVDLPADEPSAIICGSAERDVVYTRVTMVSGGGVIPEDTDRCMRK